MRHQGILHLHGNIVSLWSLVKFLYSNIHCQAKCLKPYEASSIVLILKLKLYYILSRAAIKYNIQFGLIC